MGYYVKNAAGETIHKQRTDKGKGATATNVAASTKKGGLSSAQSTLGLTAEEHKKGIRIIEGASAKVDGKTKEIVIGGRANVALQIYSGGKEIRTLSRGDIVKLGKKESFKPLSEVLKMQPRGAGKLVKDYTKGKPKDDMKTKLAKAKELSAKLKTINKTENPADYRKIQGQITRLTNAVDKYVKGREAGKFSLNRLSNANNRFNTALGKIKAKQQPNNKDNKPAVVKNTKPEGKAPDGKQWSATKKQADGSKGGWIDKKPSGSKKKDKEIANIIKGVIKNPENPT